MTDPLDGLRRYADSLRAEVTPAHARARVESLLSGIEDIKDVERPRRRLATALASGAAAFLVGNVGLAAAAQPAVPGDLLYPVDRAYESVAGVLGVGGNDAAERLDEVETLLDAGRVGEGLALLDETLEAPIPAATLDRAVAALDRAATPEATDEAVQAAIEDLRDVVGDQRGEGGGSEISDAARDIGEAARGSDGTAASEGPTDGPPAGGGNAPPGPPAPSGAGGGERPTDPGPPEESGGGSGAARNG